MNPRIVAGGLALVLIAGLLWLLIAQDTEVDAPAPEPVAAEPAPPPAPANAPLRVAERAKLARSAGVPEPEWPEERPEPSVITPDDKKKMNYAVDDVLRDARDECIVPWIDEIAEPVEAEFVFDAVLWDGQVYEAGIRSLNLEIPQPVLTCIGDKVWIREWPTWELNGELRLQRQITYRNEAMMPDPVDHEAIQAAIDADPNEPAGPEDPPQEP